MSLRFSINSSKYVHFWTLVLNTILILIKVAYQRYISRRHWNFDPTHEIWGHGDFPPFWKSGILRLVEDFVVCNKMFLEIMGPYKNVKQKFSVDSNIFTGLYYRQGLDYILKTLRKCCFSHSRMVEKHILSLNCNHCWSMGSN